MITFTGTYITPATILKRNGDNFYKHKASIVELSPNSKEDLRTLKNVSALWQNSSTHEIFANKIYRTACAKSQGDYSNVNLHIYAVTNQRDRFEKLREDEVLGLAQVSDITNDLLELDFCQVAPECEYNVYDREYSGVGNSLLEFLKTAFSTASIVVSIVRSAIPFYKQAGFKSISLDNSRWMLQR